MEMAGFGGKRSLIDGYLTTTQSHNRHAAILW